MTHIELRTKIAASLEVVFDLARSIDAHLGSMGKSREQAVAGVTTGLIGLGEQVTWRATHFGMPFKMTSKVTAMSAPDWFVDEQIKGPFRRFHHEHRFERRGTATMMIDIIDFTSPAALVGRMVDRIFLEHYMAKLIKQRNDFLKTAAEAKPHPD